MAEAFLWGLLASGTLLLGALVAFVFRPGPRVNALVLALGSGVLIGSIAYELVEDALAVQSFPKVAFSLFLGSASYVVGVRILARGAARHRKSPMGHEVAHADRGGEPTSAAGALPGTTPTEANRSKAVADSAASSKAIVVGSVLDGIPESFVIGLSVLTGGVSLPFFAGVALSNFPEGMASSSGLVRSGWSQARVLALWSAVAVVSAVAAAAGYAVFSGGSDSAGGLAQAFAAGALLTMIADAMLPEAYAVEREWTGALVVVGFALAVGLGAL